MENKIWSSVRDLQVSVSDAFGCDCPAGEVVAEIAQDIWQGDLVTHGVRGAEMSQDAWDALDLVAMSRSIERASH